MAFEGQMCEGTGRDGGLALREGASAQVEVD